MSAFTIPEHEDRRASQYVQGARKIRNSAGEAFTVRLVIESLGVQVYSLCSAALVHGSFVRERYNTLPYVVD